MSQQKIMAPANQASLEKVRGQSANGKIGHDDRAGLFVAAAEEAEQGFGFSLVQSQVVMFVADDQVDTCDALSFDMLSSVPI